MLLLFSFAFSWIAVIIGLSVSSVEVAQTAGFMWLFPLTFASSAFVPVDDMPSWLKAFAEVNPVTITVDALRGWFDGTPVGNDGWYALAWCLGVLAVFVPLAVWKFRKASTK
jgi:ABC-2 type transport system permease protein/oleandomycin transport system permease protein